MNAATFVLVVVVILATAFFCMAEDLFARVEAIERELKNLNPGWNPKQ